MNTLALPELMLVEVNSAIESESLKAVSRLGIPHRITIRRDGPEALDHLLGSRDPLPALVILDHWLPHVDGLDILTQLRLHDRTRRVPVVIFSRTPAESEVMECYQAGANSYVVKPMDTEAYIDRLAWIAHYWLSVNHPPDLNPGFSVKEPASIGGRSRDSLLAGNR
jgi:two-component system response regulator